MNPFEAIQSYDRAFGKWWDKVIKLGKDKKFDLPVELDPNHEYAPGKFMEDIDPFGCYDDGMSPAEFVSTL